MKLAKEILTAKQIYQDITRTNGYILVKLRFKKEEGRHWF